MSKFIKALVNTDGKYNKFIVAGYGATITFCHLLGYDALAKEISVVGAALGVILVSNHGAPTV